MLGCVRCGGWRVWTRSLKRPVSRTLRRSTGNSAGAPGLFRVDADTTPCGSGDATPGSRACVRVLALLGRVGQAGLPGTFLCVSPFPFAALAFCFAWPLRSLCFFFFPCPRPRCLSLSLVSGPGCLEPWRCALLFFSRLSALRALSLFFFPLAVGCSLLLAAPPAILCVRLVSLLLAVSPFFFLPACAPVVFGFLWFPAPGALGLRAVFCLLCGPPASRASVRSLLFLCLDWPFLAPCWLLPPPPFCVSRFSSLPLGAVCRVSRVAVLRCAAARCVARCCAVVCCVVLLRSVGAAARRAVPSGAPRRPRPCALRRSVLRCSPPLCVFCRCVVVCAVVHRSAWCCVCSWVLFCVFPVLSALCGALLRCAGDTHTTGSTLTTVAPAFEG